MPIPLHLENVLTLVSRNPDCSVELLHQKLKDDISSNAVNNRLHDLLKAGLVKRRRMGKSYFYTISRKTK